MVKVAVIGAGINGLSSALRIKQKYPDFEIVLIFDKYSPETTGDGSGGLWYPYLVGDTPEEKLVKWGCESYKYLLQMWLKGGYDISLMPVYVMSSSEKTSRPKWADNVFGYKDIDGKLLDYLNDRYSSNYSSGHTFTTFVTTPTSLLSCFTHKYISSNGRFKNAKITSLHDPQLQEYDVIINTSGLGATYIVPDDNVFPIRGQIVKINAQWLNETVIDDQGCYIIPNALNCVLGGTGQKNDWNTNVDPKDTELILSRCRQMIPALQHADIIKKVPNKGPYLKL